MDYADITARHLVEKYGTSYKANVVFYRHGITASEKIYAISRMA